MVCPSPRPRSLDPAARSCCQADLFVDINALQPDVLGMWVIGIARHLDRQRRSGGHRSLRLDREMLSEMLG